MHAYAHCNPQPSPCHCRLGGATPRSCCCKPGMAVRTRRHVRIPCRHAHHKRRDQNSHLQVRQRLTTFKKADVRASSCDMNSMARSGMLEPSHFIPPDQTASVSMKYGTFGQLDFVGGTKRRLLDSSATNLEDARQAKVCRVNIQSDVAFQTLPELSDRPSQQEARVRVIRGLVDYIKHGWEVAMPSVIFDVVGELESGNELSEETHQAATGNAVEPASGVDGLSSVTDQDIEKNAGVMHDRRLMAHTTGRAAALAVLFTQQHWEADAASVPRGYNEDGEEIDTARSAAIVEDEFTTLLEETGPQQQRQTELDSEPEPQSELELESEPEREPVLDTAQTEHQRNFEQPKLDLRVAAHFDGSPPLLPPPHDSRRTVSTPREQCSLHSFQHVSTAATLCC